MDRRNFYQRPLRAFERRWILLAFVLLNSIVLLAQNVAINADGSKANPNAMLDIKSSDKGLLIPRITSEARLRIANTQGLLVYDVNTNSFWYNTGKSWINLSPSADALSVADSAWSLLGNAGTVDGVNFLGTTDNVPLNIRVNNQKAGRIDHVLSNTFWGIRSGVNVTAASHDNTGIGGSALFANTNGFNNTAVGSNALQNNTVGFQNSANGRLALYSNTIGANNTATGESSMFANTTGHNNTAYGTGSLFNNTSGTLNTGVGLNAMLGNTTGTLNASVGALSLGGNGSANTAMGAEAMRFNNSSAGNTAVGYRALATNSTGQNNTAVGLFSLEAVGTGSFNTAIGAFTNVVPENSSNSTAIGNGAVVSGSNKVRIGNEAVTVIEGQVPFTSPSDGRFKFGVQEDVKGLDFILQLRPVTYNFDTKRFAQFNEGKIDDPVMDAAYVTATGIRRSGFIAQEVEQAAIQSGYNFSGIIIPNKDHKHYSLSYDVFVVPLVKAVQEQQQLISDQQKTIEDQNKKIAALEANALSSDKKLSALQKELDEIRKLLQR